jgi:hypothetical protein
VRTPIVLQEAAEDIASDSSEILSFFFNIRDQNGKPFILGSVTYEYNRNWDSWSKLCPYLMGKITSTMVPSLTVLSM